MYTDISLYIISNQFVKVSNFIVELILVWWAIIYLPKFNWALE